MKALITGGAGFIGYHLTQRLLKDNYQVHILDDFSRGVKDSFLEELCSNKNVKIISADLMDKNSLDELDSDYDYIFHLAAIIGVQNVLSRSYDVLKNNVEILINMIEFAKNQTNLKRFVFTSTSEIYAGTLKYYGMEIPTPESTPLAITPFESPRTSYMLSKIYGEALLYQSNIPFTIVRPHNFYGPRMGMSHVIPELLRKVYNNEYDGVLKVYSADHKRTFCYIDDAVEFIVRLAESEEAKGKSFNVGNDSPEVTMREVAEMVLQTVGKDYPIEELPPTEGSPERRCPNVDMAKQYAKYEGVVDIKEGIKRTFEWYKTNVFDGDIECAK